MNLPGLLIEYLFTGALSLPWALRLVGLDPFADTWEGNFQEWMVPFLVVGVYVQGMALDLLAFHRWHLSSGASANGRLFVLVICMIRAKVRRPGAN